MDAHWKHFNRYWNLISTTGAIDSTWDVTATCGTPDSYGVRACILDSSSCTDGASVCTGSFPASFDLMDVPGVALFVHTGSGADAQLHIGFAKDSTACAQDVSGDYTMIHTGLGNNENFGMYRSDANFISISHSDFGFDTADSNLTQTLAYRTGTPSSVLTNDGCVDGVRTRGLGGGETIRSMMTASGLFVLDFPAGQGGLISFKTSNAATLADFANKSFGGISFPDNSNPEPISATSGAVSGNNITLSATINGVSESLDINALGIAATASNPTYPDFNVAPAGYPANALAIDYATPTNIPGLFKIDNPSDNGRVIIAAMLFNDKVIAVGMVYNLRNTGDTNPATGNPFETEGLYNTGNFLLFEK
ncbi:MAG: hypothetical protein OQK46_05525 [Gammaproteobacteria bacterium]|nr:hypothetical protein [Gammaproteobacteria bacterium]